MEFVRPILQTQGTFFMKVYSKRHHFSANMLKKVVPKLCRVTFLRNMKIPVFLGKLIIGSFDY